MNLAKCRVQNTWKSTAFLYTNNERSEREIKETIPFIITSKIIKYLGINLPKEAKDLYFENYEMQMKEIKDDTNRWKGILCSWVEKNQNPRQSTDSMQFLFSFFFFPSFFLARPLSLSLFSRATPAAYGGSQARGLIGAVAAGLHQSHSNTGSEPRLRSTPQLHHNAGSLTH